MNDTTPQNSNLLDTSFAHLGAQHFPSELKTRETAGFAALVSGLANIQTLLIQILAASSGRSLGRSNLDLSLDSIQMPKVPLLSIPVYSFRIPEPGGVDPYFGFQRSFYFAEALPTRANGGKPRIASVLIRKSRYARRGVRVIIYASVVDFIAKHLVESASLPVSEAISAPAIKQKQHET